MHPMSCILYFVKVGLIHLRIKLFVNFELLLVEILRVFSINEFYWFFPFSGIVFGQSKFSQTLVSFVSQYLQIYFPLMMVLAFFLRNLRFYESSDVFVDSSCINLLIDLAEGQTQIYF